MPFPMLVPFKRGNSEKTKLLANMDSIITRGRAHSPISPAFYRSGSPWAQEIVASDLESVLGDASECEDSQPTSTDSKTDATLSVSSLYIRPTGIIFGATPRPALAPQNIEQVSALFDTHREPELSLNAERSLLRDNHLLSPKHQPPERRRAFSRLYRYLFSPDGRAQWDPDLVPTETSPLLLHSDNSDGLLTGLASHRWDEAVATNTIQTTWLREALTLILYARPLSVTFLLHYSVTMVSIFTVGRMGRVELAAVSLATVTANITCYTPIQGLATSLDTLCAQAFGSGHKTLMGIQCQRMLALLCLLLVPLIALWYHADIILTTLIPERETALLAARYLRVLSIGTPGVAAFETAKRFVQAQGMFHATTYVLLVGAPFSVLANWLFVFHWGWGFIGAPIAIVCAQTLLPVLLISYVFFVEGAECWDGLSRRALVNWGPMVRLALPGMIMIEAQYFAFEVLTLVAGQFGGAALAAQSVLVTLGSNAYQVPFAVSIAASTRVANLVGAGLAGAAVTSTRVAIVAGIVLGSMNLAILTGLRHVLPKLFTEDAAIATQVVQVIPVLALLQVFDATAAVLHGCLRGIGRQHVGGYTNLLSFYVIALPVSFSTSFLLNWELTGLWVGVTIGLVITTTVEIVYLFYADFECAVIEAENRMILDNNATTK